MEVETAKRYLAAWLDAAKAEPPLLLVGDGSSVDELMLYARQYLTCIGGPKPCTMCAGCRQALAGGHPDISSIQGSERTISLQAIKQLLEQALNTALHGKRLLVIPQAERLSPPAAAALLKTLEEPSASARWLLATAYKRRMIPTILSRCASLHVSQPPRQTPAFPMPAFGQTTEALTAQELGAITAFLEERLRQPGSGQGLLKACLRLRDYYKIKSQRGNEKLAGQVLLATLADLR